MPPFSIIVPIYMIEDYLPTCIDSILSQTFHDFELILVDDGSPDSCGKICDEYAEKDQRIRVIHKKNGGVSSARNCGIDAAKGTWIWFVDGDDYIEPHSLEQFYAAIAEESADLYVFNCKGIRERFLGVLEEFLQKYYFTYILGFGPWNKLYNAYLIRQFTLRFDEQETVGEDLLFNIKYYSLLYARRKNSVIFLGRDYYHYVDRAGSAMNTHSKMRLEQQVRLFDKIENILAEKVTSQTLCYFFLLHLISGIKQGACGGLTAQEFANYFDVNHYRPYIDYIRNILPIFFQNEGSAFGGRIRLLSFVHLLQSGRTRLAGRILGLK